MLLNSRHLKPKFSTMKRKLFTGALLTTFVVGAALFSNANTNSKRLAAAYYYNTGSGCQTVNCENVISGPFCSSISGTFYDLNAAPCSEPVPKPTTGRLVIY